MLSSLKKLSLLVVGATLTLAATQVRADLVAHLPFDGDLADASGNGNDGVYLGPAERVPVFVDGFDGTASGAMSFAGDELVSLTQTAGLPLTNDPAFSVAMWVRGAVQSDRRVFSEGTETSGTPLFNLGTHNTGANGALNSFLRPGPNHRQTTGIAFDGTWHHIAWVDDNGVVDVYIDGVRDPRDMNYARSVRVLDKTSIGGILRAAAGNWFTGAIDEVYLYNHALDELEVQRLIPTPGCPEEGDTHATGIELLARPFLNGPGLHTVEASATDDSGDTPFYTFFAYNTETGALVSQVGPQASASASVPLPNGSFEVVVRVDDDRACFDRAEDDTRSIEVTVGAAPTCISQWSFDGDLLDSGPGMNDGTFTGDEAPNYVAGPEGFGRAVEFDGVDDYVSFTQSNGLPIYTNTAYSVAMWVKGAPGQVDRRIFSEGSTTDNTPLLNIGTGNTADSSSKLDIFVRFGGTLVNHAKSARDVFDDTWHHIAWVDDNGSGKMYIDGVLDAVMPTYVRPAGVALNTTTVGAILRATSCCWFAGAIDETRVYNYALSEEEILALVPEPDDCDGVADTSCDSLVIEGPEDDTAGVYTITAVGSDISSTDPVLYQFFVDFEDGSTTFVGPQLANSVNISLPAGVHRIRVEVDDDILCRDAVGLCDRVIEVLSEPRRLLAHYSLDGTLQDSVTLADGVWMDADETGAAYVPGYDDCVELGAASFRGDTPAMAEIVGDDLIVIQGHPDLPVSQRSAFSISAWVRAEQQSDKRIYSESNTQGNNNALFNLGSDNTGATGALDFFLRNDGGTQIAPHVKSAGVVFDGTWHHVVWTDNNGTVVCYIDGVPDATDFSYAREVITLDTATIGGILRASTCCELTGDVDEVGIYNYILEQEDVDALYGAGPVECCPAEGDTHCDGLEVTLAADGVPAGVADTVSYLATASATDDSGDAVIYTFTATPAGGGDAIVVGPQAGSTAEFVLTEGTWTIEVAVDDDPKCDDVAVDAVCSTELVVEISRGIGPFLRGDCNGDGATGGVTDAIFHLGFNFLGGTTPPCRAACDSNGDGAIGGVTDPVYLLNFNFLGGTTPPAPFPQCGTSEAAGDIALGCETPLGACRAR